MYCLGGFFGYLFSIYFCTIIKLNLSNSNSYIIVIVISQTELIVIEVLHFLNYSNNNIIGF